MLVLKEDSLIKLAKLKYFSLAVVLFSSCAIPFYTKKPVNQYYIGPPKIEVVGNQLSKGEKEAIGERLYGQLDDSSKPVVKSPVFFLDIIKSPPVFDTASASQSAENMKGSLFHLGYYNPTVQFHPDTSGKKVTVKFKVDVGKQTRIDTISYKLQKNSLQEIALQTKNESALKEQSPITKTAVLTELSRLTDSFRNNGYYKFTASELRIQGDTSIEALTNISDDPFEQLQLLAEAQAKRDSPTIKLAVVLNNPQDSSRLQQYRINNITIYPDLHLTGYFDSTKNIQLTLSEATLIYHQFIFQPSFVLKNLTIKKGDLYRQNEYYQTLSNFSRTGMWQSVNINLAELPNNLIDVVIELIPVKKFGLEMSIEGSYSAVSNQANAIGGSLFGLSGNMSLVNRNLSMFKGKIGGEGIQMSHALRAGVEFNNKSRTNTATLVNAIEFGYSNRISISRLVLPQLIPKLQSPHAAESFIYTSLAFANRLNLFSLQSFGFSIGSTRSWKNTKLTFRPLYAEFNYLFNETEAFKTILENNQFLRYSYNTALVLGMNANFTWTRIKLKNLTTNLRQTSVMAEESGLTWGALPVLKLYKKRYFKIDFEHKLTKSRGNSALALRAFAGFGIPITNADTTLPFFKQYFSGGSTSMRGWPARGIGRGSEKMAPYQSVIFNDRLGDVKIELNAEQRFLISNIISNTLTLRGAVFADAGNIWNWKPSYNGTVQSDSAQFKLNKIYKELGVASGVGLRLDFNYVVLRLDLGFRFKRPELSQVNDGWRAPNISFNDFIPKIFGRKYKEWRYENMNFTVGINYPF